MKKLILFLMVLQLSLFASEKLDDKLNALHDAVRYENIDLLKYLLSKDLDTEQKDEFGNTPLHLAVRAGNFQMVKILLDHYVKTNTKNGFGDTAILIASRNGNTKIVKELICAGATYDIVDVNNISALQYSIQNNSLELAQILSTPIDKQDCGIKLSFNDFSKTKTNKICGKVLRGKVNEVVFFILDTQNTALIESTKAKLSDNGRKWCAKSNAFGSLSGEFEIFVNGYGDNKKGKASQKFTK